MADDETCTQYSIFAHYPTGERILQWTELYCPVGYQPIGEQETVAYTDYWGDEEMYQNMENRYQYYKFSFNESPALRVKLEQEWKEKPAKEIVYTT